MTKQMHIFLQEGQDIPMTKVTQNASQKTALSTKIEACKTYSTGRRISHGMKLQRMRHHHHPQNTWKFCYVCPQW